MAIRPQFLDQVLAQMPTSAGLSSRAQYEMSSDNFIILMNEVLQEGTAQVAGQSNNMLYPYNLISWGDCHIVTEETTRWRSTLTVFVDAPVDDNGVPIPLSPTPTPFNTTLDLTGKVILYEYMAQMPTRTTGEEQDRMYGVVLYRDLDTGEYTGKHYAMIQERRGTAERTASRNWRRHTL